MSVKLGYHRIEDLPQEINLIGQRIQFGFQVHFDHVGCISVLDRKKHQDTYSIAVGGHDPLLHGSIQLIG